MNSDRPMEKVNEQQYRLIEAATEVINKNYDGVNYNHTVGAAVLCDSGKIYVGVNVYSIHGACAEQVAIGSAISNGERNFLAVVAVRGGQQPEILAPCGNCRQMLSDYAPECQVIVPSKDGGIAVFAKELLPFAYKVEY